VRIVRFDLVDPVNRQRILGVFGIPVTMQVVLLIKRLILGTIVVRLATIVGWAVGCAKSKTVSGVWTWCPKGIGPDLDCLPHQALVLLEFLVRALVDEAIGDSVKEAFPHVLDPSAERPGRDGVIRIETGADN